MDLSIDSSRLRIRPFEPGDVEDFVGFMTDPESTRFLAFDQAQKNREGATQLLLATIESYTSDTPWMAFAVEASASRRFVGFCGLTPRDEREVEIMYAIMPNARGKGYAVEVASALANYAVERLGYRRVIAPISPEHAVSKAVAAKAGFDDFGISTGPDSSKRVHLFVYKQSHS